MLATPHLVTHAFGPLFCVSTLCVQEATAADDDTDSENCDDGMHPPHTDDEDGGERFSGQHFPDRENEDGEKRVPDFLFALSTCCTHSNCSLHLHSFHFVFADKTRPGVGIKLPDVSRIERDRKAAKKKIR